MSHADHEWARELLPAHLAGGLNADERARLETHTATCAECIAEIDALRRFNRGMEAMFDPVRARAGLEERVIRSLRAAPIPTSKPPVARFVYGIAAALLLGIVGFAVMNLAEDGRPLEALTGSAKREARDPEASVVAGVPAGRYREEAEERRAQQPLSGADFPVAEREPSLFFPEAKASDHNESVDELSKMRDDSRDFLSFADQGAARGRVGGKVMGPVAPGVAPAPAAKPAPPRENLYTYRPGDAEKAAESRSGAFQPETERALLIQTGDRDKSAARYKDAETKQLQDKKGADAPKVEQDPKTAPAQQARKIIRSGEMEFEIDSFDSAVVKIDTIAAEEQGVIATVNSEKLPNGKVRGTVVIRVAPDHLGTLIIKLRALGELKSQKLGSEDVTKAYYDLESRLRAARTMEERLIKIIKEGNGAIKDLLMAEKELGEWRTKIEMYEGERRYYDTMVSMSTLTIQLFEKEIRAAFGITETERVDAGVEVEDVEKAHKDLTAAVGEAKGRILKSDLKKLAAGQFTGTLHFEVAPEASGALRDRLKQLGTVARLDVTTAQQVEGGSGRTAEAKLKRNDTQFFVSLYNLANVAPRETNHLSLACADTEKTYKAILQRVEKAAGRVRSSSLNQQKADQVNGVVDFEVKSADAEAVLLDIRALGEVMSLVVTENSDLANVTKSKRGFVVNLAALGSVQPRESTTVQLAAKEVPAAYRALTEALTKLQARVFAANLNETDRRNISATLSFEILRSAEKEFSETMLKQGEVFSRVSSRAQDQQNVVDSKVRIDLTLFPVTNVPPREMVRLSIEASKVDQAIEGAQKISAELKGRVSDPQRTRTSSGGQVGRLVLEIPHKDGRTAVQRLKALGEPINEESRTNSAIPEGELATTKIEVTISNEVMVPTESAPWASIKKGFSVSLLALSWALTLIMIGLCFVAPLALLGWGGWKLSKKMKKAPTAG